MIITAYHTSPISLTKFKNKSAMWFTDRIELAKAYHEYSKGERGIAWTYEVIINGNILSTKNFSQACKNFKINEDELIPELVSNPDNILSNPDIKKIQTICDGFYHSDYDPRDNQKDVENILVFNPNKNVKLINKKLKLVREHL
jgi:hypothetical protein